MKIIIYSGAIIDNDAIGNDVLKQYQEFSDQGISTQLFARKADEETKPLLVTSESFINLIQDKRNILIIHYGSYWSGLIEYLNLANCTVVFKYHNVTPGHFFEKYNKSMAHSLDRSKKMLKKIIDTDRIDFYWADSNYNASELISYSVDANKITIVPPFHKIYDFEKVKTDVVLKERLSDGILNLLFVGRVSPNKGHIHLIRTLQSYKKKYGNNVHLNIVGTVSCALFGYYKELKKLIKTLDLEDMVSFYDHVTFEQLNTFYKTADLFLLMSEHEGFCVPILEAQYHRVPIVALDRTAVKETLGEEQLAYEKIDYEVFASAIYTVTTDNEIRHYLIKQGYNNFLKYEANKIGKIMLHAVSSIR